MNSATTVNVKSEVRTKKGDTNSVDLEVCRITRVFTRECMLVYTWVTRVLYIRFVRTLLFIVGDHVSLHDVHVRLHVRARLFTVTPMSVCTRAFA